MSRNLCTDICKCREPITRDMIISGVMSIEEITNKLSKQADNRYNEHYLNVTFAMAICHNCNRQWIVWLSHTTRDGLDLSYWHTFNDEPCYNNGCYSCYGIEAKRGY